MTLGTLAEEDILVRGTTLDVAISAIVCGDVHPSGGGDGDVDILDALRILKFGTGLVTPDAREREAADVNLCSWAGSCATRRPRLRLPR